MLTLDREETTSPLNYDDLNSSIKDTFAAIDRFELQAVEAVARITGLSVEVVQQLQQGKSENQE
ncbi:hypothetical protein [Nostoc sp. CHAB 5715]|uniref:hypothetical protein n=1 Tax=Nostoc sp. CHAB 5715 TaxID=2780400 RepID=UPI001E3D1F44|nr:hypothetical protein [Nostoc sp. CHAB 5715]MCC5623111.1 hypothetical protein [Nostoc sp. CHAB 5715]